MPIMPIVLAWGDYLLLAVLAGTCTGALIVLLLRYRQGVGAELAAVRALLSKAAQDAGAQTDYLQKIYHLQSRALLPGIEADRQHRLLDALLQSGYYDTREARDSLAAACPDKLRNSLARNNIPRLDLQTILQRAARWDSDCLRAVLDQAIDDLNGSAAGKELRTIRAELAPATTD